MAESSGFRRRRVQRSNVLDDPVANSLPPSPSYETVCCRSSISSLFISTSAPNTSSSSCSRKKGFASTTFRGLGCASPPEVSSPVAVRPSVDWQAKRFKKKKQRRKHQAAAGPAAVVPEAWCSPGIALAADAASVNCVVPRRTTPGTGRGYGDRNQEHSCITRRNNALEQISAMDSPFSLQTHLSGSELLAARYYPHMRGFHRSSRGLAEVLMLQTGYMLSGTVVNDRYRDWRLDVDSMTYEDLLELGDRIGYVSTGLREEQVLHCLRKISISDNLPPQSSVGLEWKCSICQEEYEDEDEVGKLGCDHCYHLDCIKQWLLQKNECPVCKVAAVADQ